MLREIYFFNLGVITGGSESWCLLACSLCLSTYQHIFVWPENLAMTKSYNIQIFLFLCLLLNWHLLNNHSLFLKRDLFIHKMHHWRKSKSCIFFFFWCTVQLKLPLTSVDLGLSGNLCVEHLSFMQTFETTYD